LVKELIIKHNKLRPIHIIFYSKWDSFDKWSEKLLKYNIILHRWPEVLEDNIIYSDIEGALVWDPPNDMWSFFPNLKIIQSLGAGVDHILSKSYPKSVNIIKLNDPNLSNQMAEYVLMSALMCYRKFFQYSINKKKKYWKQITPFDKKDFIITILGYGTISKLVTKKLIAMGFIVKVWSKTKRKPRNIDYYYGDKGLNNSLKNSSCLISLLPATADTYNLIGLSEFTLLSSESYLINVGRGYTINEEELITALKDKVLSGAILDVFSKEPLNKNNELWNLNNVYLTPHIAGITNATDSAAKTLRNNFDLLRKNKTLINKVDSSKGY
jgi:glyoxylate/hydroxypyruvate reductase